MEVLPNRKHARSEDPVEDEQKKSRPEELQSAASPPPPTSADDTTFAHNCVHEICLPENYTPSETEESIARANRDRPPAKTYPFTLDPFQQAAVNCINRGQSVLVSAHTSAGKTAVALYAIAMALRDNQRVIYTSPIKALSNQKYRELVEEFENVGLMTGDVTINPNSNCLVMTTEILRSMLYRGTEVLREVAWVIFDEVHYMRDKERGVVWEETLVMLPHQIRYVFLSATIPNGREFAEWIAQMHNQPVNLISTDYRPVPLQHYVFPAGGNGLHLVLDENGNFREENFNRALASLAAPGSLEAALASKRPKKPTVSAPSKDATHDVYRIVKLVMEKNYDPVIVFCFRKREVESRALGLAKLDFNNNEEKALVDAVFTNAIDSLSDDDRALPQIQHLLPLLKRGIGVHHSGLLPLLKEIVEILFQEGLIKVLFATETFSMGLNMPAKTVVFSSVRKFDGRDFRIITSGEYIQMSGRAGRRGLDDRGIVITMLDEKMEPTEAKTMIKGQADPLNSQFHLSFNMILNTIRVEGATPEFMIQHSFLQFQAKRALPDRRAELARLEGSVTEIAIADEPIVAALHHIREQLERYRREIVATVTKPIHCLPYLQAGRLVKVADGEDDWGWGVVVNFMKKFPAGNQLAASNKRVEYVADVLLNCDPETTATRPRPAQPEGVPATLDGRTSKGKRKPQVFADMQVLPVCLHTIQAISSLRIFLPKDLRPPANRQSVHLALQEVQRMFPDGLPVLDPVEDMRIDDEDFRKLVRKVEVLEERYASNPRFRDEDIQGQLALYQQKADLKEKVTEQKKAIKIAESMILKTELRGMKRVLRRLGYLDEDNVVTTKGRVACEINSGNELLVTELVFTGLFNELDANQAVALLSCMATQEKSQENTRPRDDLVGPFQQMQEIAARIGKVSQESELPIDVEEFVQSFKPHLAEAAYQWTKGSKFSQICQLTDIFEGNIIRSFRRIEELLQQLSAASKTIGAEPLSEKFVDASTRMKRDIVFAASLYL